MIRLFLVRHGENRANITKEFSHHKVDYPLTAKGILQAQQTAQALAAYQVNRVYASPLLRAAQTAQWIAASHNQQPVILEELREINVGSLEGAPVSAELWQQHNAVLERWFKGDLAVRFPQGESGLEVKERFRLGLQRMLEDADGQILVAAGHGGIFTFGLDQLYPPADASALLTESHNCSISEFEVQWTQAGPQTRLVRWGDASHLSGKAAELVSGGFDPREEPPPVWDENQN